MVVTGVAKALIATGYGLIVAILAVIFNNTYTNMVKRFNDEFLLLKLLFLSFVATELPPPLPFARHVAVEQPKGVMRYGYGGCR